jgi:Domain of unknown function (DUF1843)
MEAAGVTGMTDVKPYGVAIQQAVATGDLARMKTAAAAADAYLQECGNVSAALEILKTEIAKLEAKQ